MKTTGNGDFSIGNPLWPGISKLVEEAAEVQQVCGKLIGSHGEPMHWDGTNLRARLEEELSDLIAAIRFVERKNDLDSQRIEERVAKKLETFEKWHTEGLKNKPSPTS